MRAIYLCEECGTVCHSLLELAGCCSVIQDDPRDTAA